MNVFGGWKDSDVELHNQRVAAGKQSTPGVEPTPTAAGATPASRSVSLEASLHAYIEEWWRSKGWLLVHSRMDRATTTAKGVSDFILVCPKTVLFVECKRPGGKPTKEQLEFLAHVRKIGWPNAVVYSKEEFHAFVDPLIQ